MNYSLRFPGFAFEDNSVFEGEEIVTRGYQRRNGC